MRKHTALSVVGVALLGIAPLCHAAPQEDKTTTKAVHQEMADTADSIRNYTADQRDEAVKKAQAALAALDARIDALEARIDKDWNKMDKAARTKARNTLQALRRQRVAVAEWYGGLQNSTAEAWDDIKGVLGCLRIPPAELGKSRTRVPGKREELKSQATCPSASSSMAA